LRADRRRARNPGRHRDVAAVARAGRAEDPACGVSWRRVVNHLTPEQRSAHLDGAADAAERAAVERHLAECASCRAALAEQAALDTALGRALEHDPGETYFATFAD